MRAPKRVSALPRIAMLAAVILGGSELLVTEAAVAAILVSTLSSTPEVRLLDVLIGGVRVAKGSRVRLRPRRR